MTDLRQGVSPAMHAVLNYLEAQEAEWSDLYDVTGQLRMAHARTRNALYASDNPIKKRQLTVEAAARLIDAISEMDRELTADAAMSTTGKRQ